MKKYSFLLSLYASFFIPSIVCTGSSNHLTFLTTESSNVINQDIDFLTLKQQVFHQIAESWCSQEKAELIMDIIFATRPEVCVEIGAFTGSSVLPAAATLQHLKQGHMYAIDAWSNEEAIKNVSQQDPNYDWWAKVDMIEIHNRCVNLLKQWHLFSCCSVIHAPAAEAIFQIGEIDFLHLDGNLSEEGSLLDLQLFLPKVKSGGYILLSNLFLLVDNKLTKMSSMWNLFDHCEVICEINNNNVVLFRKN